MYVTDRIARDLIPLFKQENKVLKFVISEKNENDFLFLRRIRREIEEKSDLLTLLA